MEDHSGAVGPGEANRQAIATGGTTDQMVEDDQDTPPGRGGLVIAALGVVFGDIGTSPVYTFRQCFNPEHGLALTQDNVLGVLSCLIWALVLVVAVKYVLLIMRADNQGEGEYLPSSPWLSGELPASTYPGSLPCSAWREPRSFTVTA